jgi:hypothetical protein
VTRKPLDLTASQHRQLEALVARQTAPAGRGALAVVLLLGVAACSDASPPLMPVVDSSSAVKVSVLDIDPMAVRDCQQAVLLAIDRHELAGALAGAVSTKIEVSFTDGSTADLMATINSRPGKPLQVLASSSAGLVPARYDLRSAGSRARTRACDLGAERLAVEIAARLGVGKGP